MIPQYPAPGYHDPKGQGENQHSHGSFLYIRYKDDPVFPDVGYQPSTPIEVGIGKFVDWYLDYYQVKNS